MPPAVSGTTIFDDIFEVIDKDPDGKKFDKVSRFRCRSQFEAELSIDVNVDIYKLDVGTKFTLALAPTLSLDGTPEDAETYDQVRARRPRPLSLVIHQSAPPAATESIVVATTDSPTPRPSPPPRATAQTGKESLADAYEYVMYGKVFKKEDENVGGIAKTCVTASYGGLLMQLRADQKNLADVEIDLRVYVLIRKIA